MGGGNIYSELITIIRKGRRRKEKNDDTDRQPPIPEREELSVVKGPKVRNAQKEQEPRETQSGASQKNQSEECSYAGRKILPCKNLPPAEDFKTDRTGLDNRTSLDGWGGGEGAPGANATAKC